MNTLGQLSDAWNALRNAALGRGTTPLVSASLAAAVGTDYESFRSWLAAKGPAVDLQAQFTFDDATAGWVDRYESLAVLVTNETGKQLPATPIPALQQGVRTAITIAAPPLAIAAVLGILAYAAINGARRR